MLWHTEMACGVHLGILLICLVQAEHVCCWWAAQAQSSQRQNSNRYVGLSQQESGQRLGSSNPQNELRPASAQSSSFNTEPAVISGYSQGLSSQGYTNTLSQPHHSGSSTVKLVKTRSRSKPIWQVSKLNRMNAQTVPKKQSFGLSTAIASGTSVSKYSQKSNALDVSKKRSQQGTLHATKYVSSSSASVQSPSRGSTSALHSAAQRAPAAAAPTNYGQRAHTPVKSSSLFSPGAPGQQKTSIRMQTSASAPARRVTSHRSLQAYKPSGFSYPKNERIVSNPSQTGAGNRYYSNQFPVTGGSSQGNFKQTSSQSLPASNKHNAGFNFQPRSSTSQTSSNNPIFTSTQQIPRGTSSLKSSWSSRNQAQGAYNLPASGSTSAGTSGVRYAPTRIYDIPEQYGGFAIRRLKDPVDKKEVISNKPKQTYRPSTQQSSPQKPQVQTVRQQSKWQPQTYSAPQQTYTVSSRQVSYEPQVQSVHQESKWKRVRPSGKLLMPQV